ncbi:MAG: hypothetical protein ACOYWZ_01765 [Bacillota bacterium]
MGRCFGEKIDVLGSLKLPDLVGMQQKLLRIMDEIEIKNFTTT